MSRPTSVRVVVGLGATAALCALGLGLDWVFTSGPSTATVLFCVGLVGCLALLSLPLLRSIDRVYLDRRHERARLAGLFGATLDVNRSMGMEETREAVMASAGALLRTSDVVLTEDEPEAGMLAEPMRLAGRRTLWLGVGGQDRSDPFDDAERALLHALASVGAVALRNAELYAEVRKQREQLSVITGSLGEGVCALAEDGRITFMNPAGADMLGLVQPGGGEDGPVVPTGEAPSFLREPARRAMASGRTVTSDDTQFQRLDGSIFPVAMTVSPIVEGAAAPGAVIVFRDTSERKAVEEQLARHAFQDVLTGLSNRRLLLDHLDHALLQATRTGGAGGRAVLRHRPLQGRQRQPRPPGG